MRRTLLVVILWVCASAQLCSAADRGLLTLDDLQRVNFSGSTPHCVWLDSENYLERKRGGRNEPEQLFKINATTGASEAFISTAKMEAAFKSVPGISAESARSAARAHWHMNAARTAAFVQVQSKLFYYAFGSDSPVLLADQSDTLDNTSFSPDAHKVAFVRDYNLFVVDLAAPKPRALTTDGNSKLLNGKLDWVYQEEVYGRGDFLGYWWSPDSKRIAFLQLDESPVKEFDLIDHIPAYQALEKYTYPKAGTPNPNVKLGVVEVDGGAITWIDLHKYSKDEPIIARVGWKPDSSKLLHMVCNREQTWMDINQADPATGRTETLFRESTQAWIETDKSELPHWLDDGTFLFLSERNGWKHIFHYAADGTLLRQVTNGKWEIEKIHGVDQKQGMIYFSANEHSPIAHDIYRATLDGKSILRLSSTEGSHQASFDPGLSCFLDTWSDATTPPQTRLYRSNGELVRVLAENKVAALASYKLSKPEFLQVKTRDGFVMEAMLIKPLDFDPSKKYPVWSNTYSGPHAPSVHNSWSGHEGMWFQLLAQKGYLIWVCDNRSASGKGAESAWTSYKHFGVQELKDLEDGVGYLKTLPYVDATRIGIGGWSFGGFMTTYALTHSDQFKIGIAGGSVTDWHLYDSIYTERYMLTPEHNPAGYASTSVQSAAKNLHGKLLLIHGTMDDNVHLQNTLQLVYELQKSGKQFDLMLYPKSGHGVGDPAQAKHLREMMTKYILDNL